MKLSEMTQSTLRAGDLIELANAQLNTAKTHLEMIQWISPVGDLYIAPRHEILEMIETGSWR